MNFENFAFWLLCGLLSVLIIGIGAFLKALIFEIKGLRTEMSELNNKLAFIAANQDWHQKSLTRLEERIYHLENK